MGHDDDLRKIGIRVNTIPTTSSAASLLPGEILTQERLDLLEADALQWLGYWTPAQYSRYLGIRRAYVDRLLRYLDAYLVAPTYSNCKDRFRDAFRREVKMQDIWVAWGAEDKDLRIETLARKLADEFGQTPAEREAIFTQVTQQVTLDENLGWLDFVNDFVVMPRDFARDIQARRRVLFLE